jgi:hypothetical protein
VYSVVAHGVGACLALHRNVTRIASELVLHNDMNFCSAIMSVIGSNTAGMLLHRGGFDLGGSSIASLWTPPSKGSKGGGAALDVSSDTRYEQRIIDLKAENKRLKDGSSKEPRYGGRGGGHNGGGGHGGRGGARGGGGGNGNGGSGGGDRGGSRRLYRSRSRDRDEPRR